MSQGSGLRPREVPQDAVGYTADERLRRQQLRELRRRWLKDQELSPREPVLPQRGIGGWVEGFWERFLQPEKLWRRQVFNIYNAAKFSVLHLFIPLWIAHYIVKYHIQPTPHGLVIKNPPLYPGDRVEEKGIPPQGTPAEIPVCED